MSASLRAKLARMGELLAWAGITTYVARGALMKHDGDPRRALLAMLESRELMLEDLNRDACPPEIVARAEELVAAGARRRTPADDLPVLREDPVLGPLKWDGAWIGNVATSTLGAAVPFTVDGDERHPPTPRQREAVQRFLADEPALMAAVARANFKYYQSIKQHYRDELPPARADAEVPEVSGPQDLWRLLREPELHVPKQPRSGWRAALAWEPTWEREHGHEVQIRNGVVTRVGIIEG